MKLDGIHHVTAITGDAPRNLDFYTRVLGLRLVKKTVNQDDPTVYHLFYADEKGSPGADLTFFEYPGAAPGRAGAGMVHLISWRVASEEALEFWGRRLEAEGVSAERDGATLTFADPEGLRHELKVSTVGDAPLIADHPEVPADVALQGFDGVRAYASSPDDSRRLLEDALGFEPRRRRMGDPRGAPRRHLRLRPRAGRARAPRRRHRASRGVGIRDGRPRGMAHARAGGRSAPDRRDRPLLVQVDLLPRAQRRAVRDRHAGSRLHHRRGRGAPGRDDWCCRRASSRCARRSRAR